jgi:FkbM family methyltransferase
VAAFEPNPESFSRLERHRRMNRIPWLKTYEAAASDQSGNASLLTYGNLDSTSTHLRYDDEVENEGSGPVGIRTLRLDELVQSGELRPPNLVKIDVEGHGHRAVSGMKMAIAASRPILIVGFHSNEEVEGVLCVLKPLGYAWREIVPPPSSGSMAGGEFLFTP